MKNESTSIYHSYAIPSLLIRSYLVLKREREKEEAGEYVPSFSREEGGSLPATIRSFEIMDGYL